MTEPLAKKPPPGGDHEPPPKPKRYWWRFTLASLLIVAVTAAATATSVLLYIGSIATALSHNDALKSKIAGFLAETHGGEPENILILGSDKRANLGEQRGRSDTTILVRLDPNRDAIAVMSIPRDLKVDIPGYGINKFNAAYTFGGPRLTLRVVKELTGLSVNHVVNVDFLGFVRAVNAIGCVYTDVDRRYYHSNVGVPPSEQYSEINIQPGYQRLCGQQALEYVRYRHTDTDLVRSARQQDFLSSARQQVPVADLVLGRNKLMDIFTQYTTSDISNSETMIEVLKLFVAARNAAVKEVHFPATLGPSYVYASESAIHAAVKKFLGIEPSAGPRNSLERSAAPKRHRKKKKHHAKPRPPHGDGLEPAGEAGRLEGESAARKVGGAFPVFYPTRLPPGASFVESSTYYHVQDPRVYHVMDTSGHSHAAYRMVGEFGPYFETHYFGLQGIRGWSNPPILNNPSLTKTIGGRECEIFVDGDRIALVAWHRGGNTYWVANDLLNTLTNEQMIGLARSADVIIPRHRSRKGARG